MNSNIVIYVVSLIIIACGWANAADMSGSVSSKILAAYVLDSGVVAHNRPVIQSELCLRFPLGFYGGVWSSAKLKGEGTSWGREIYFFGGWKGEIRGIYLNSWAYYDNVSPLSRVSHGDQFKFHQEIGKKFRYGSHEILPFAKLDFTVPMQKNSPARSFHVHVCLLHSWKISSRFSWSNYADVFYDRGTSKLSAGIMAKMRTSLDFNLTKSIVLQAFEMFSTPIALKKQDERKFIPVIGMGIAYYF